MDVNTYDKMVAEVKSWCNRQDLSNDQIGTFLFYAGSQANQVLRVPAMEWTEILTVTEGGKVTIPPDFIELKAMTAPWANEQSKPLERVAWDQFVNYRASENSGDPKFFSRQGPYLWITPVPAEGEKITMHYYRTLPSIDSSEQVNWLLQLSPAAYLYGGLHYTYLFIQDEERAEYWNGKFVKELTRIQELADSVEHRGSALTIRPRETSGVR